MKLNGVKEGAGGPATGGDARVLRHKVVDVPAAPAVREEEAAARRLVKVEAGHVARTYALVLYQRTLI